MLPPQPLPSGSPHTHQASPPSSRPTGRPTVRSSVTARSRRVALLQGRHPLAMRAGVLSTPPGPPSPVARFLASCRKRKAAARVRVRVLQLARVRVLLLTLPRSPPPAPARTGTPAASRTTRPPWKRPPRRGRPASPATARCRVVVGARATAADRLSGGQPIRTSRRQAPITSQAFRCSTVWRR